MSEFQAWVPALGAARKSSAQLPGSLSWDEWAVGFAAATTERQVLGDLGGAENRECVLGAGWVGLGAPPGDRALGGAGPVRRVWAWWGLCVSGLGSSQVWGTLSLHSFVPSFIFLYVVTRWTRPCAPGPVLGTQWHLPLGSWWGQWEYSVASLGVCGCPGKGADPTLGVWEGFLEEVMSKLSPERSFR